MRTILLFFISCLCFGCSDFLDEVDKDKLIPTTTDHYAAVLLNCHRYDYPLFNGVEYMTDNLTEYAYVPEDDKKDIKPLYTWQLEVELNENGNEITTNNDAWQKMYKNIAIANYVLELIEEAEGTDVEKMFIKGEAYFVRALHYFNLLNLYGVPYNEATMRGDLGVPLRLNIGVEQTYGRNTVYECYEQIEKDLTEASRLLKESGITKSKFHPSLGACEFLFSRIYLYQEKWEKAITASTNAIAQGALSRPIEGLYIHTENPEILYTGCIYGGLNASNFDKGWQVNPELIELYDAGDARLKSFFTSVDGKVGTVYYSRKNESTFSNIGFCNFRVAEAYLNRAEAYVQSGEIEKAREDMKVLLNTRYQKANSYIIPTEETELLNFILVERRKELCFEEHHRWFDLRRMVDCPTIKHVFSLTDATGNVLGRQTYSLLPHEPNYTLPIPMRERENNPLIRNNERYEKLPETDSDIIIP